MPAFIITRIQVGDYETWRQMSTRIDRGRVSKQT